MPPVRLRSLTVRGFRAYGATEQTLNLPADLAVVWGPNSKGKTSLAEAFEFLLTGRIVRRELSASSQDEFADALRNAHLIPTEEVYVAAKIIAADGSTHEIKRTLICDYAKRQACESKFEIDGSAAKASDLGDFGIALSQPPLEAPVLAQHTLSYIFSVRPQDRATYFKTLLEVTDLDALRNDIALLADELRPKGDPLLAKFDACCAVTALNPALAGLLPDIPGVEAFSTIFESAAQALIESVGERAPDSLDGRLAVIERILLERRSKTFPVRTFDRKELAAWNPPAVEIWVRLETYIAEREKITEETRQLTTLFDEALKLPAISELMNPQDCPLCGTKFALTPGRVQLIRQHVENTKGFKRAETGAKAALSQLAASAEALATATEAALPGYLKITGSERRATGFTIARLQALLGDRAAELIGPWFARVRSLVRAGASLRREALVTSSTVEKQAAELASKLDPEKLRTIFAALVTSYERFAAAIDDYKAPTATLTAVLNEILDAQADTAGWQDFLHITKQMHELRDSLIEQQARATVEKELAAALKQIDRAKEQVLDDKFADYSTLIQAWWERLRPDEQTFFSAVQPRKGAKRTIDFKAGLSANPDRSAPKVRDVIAIFSQSQLHCLGLAMFLARAEHEGLGFIILDDPVLSSDEDYRVHFDSTVLSKLLDLSIQVIVLTQDHDTWEELETRYRHIGISTAQLYIDILAEGSIIENTSDTLLAKINRAKSLARGGHPDLRKECGIQLRDAGERFCKEMLVKHRRQAGEVASLTDYDGKTLEWLCPHIDTLLDRDASHAGKLGVYRHIVNRACHDNAPPGPAEMSQACGDIRFLVKEYLGR